MGGAIEHFDSFIHSFITCLCSVLYLFSLKEESMAVAIFRVYWSLFERWALNKNKVKYPYLKVKLKEFLFTKLQFVC